MSTFLVYIHKSAYISVDKLEEGKSYTVTFTNTPIKGELTIFKYDEDTKQPLAGAEFELYDSNNKLVSKLVSGTDGKAYIGNLPAGTYKFKETKAPSGYKARSDFYYFTVNSKSKTFSFDISNPKDTHETPSSKAFIFKHNRVTGALLEGATYDIYAAEDIYLDGVRLYIKDIIIETVTTNNGGFGTTTKKFYNGKYYAVETKAPTGYVLNTEKQYFDIQTEQTEYTPIEVVTAADAEDYIVVPDGEAKPDFEYTDVVCNVTNALSENIKVWGATVSCYYTNNNGVDVLIGTGITGKSGTVTFKHLAKNVTYKIIQTGNFDSSYDINNNLFTVVAGADSVINIKNTIAANATVATTITQVDTYDDELTVTLHKKDADTLKGLASALIYVYDSSNEVVFSGRTDQNGEITFNKIPAGTYTAEERIAPDGYVVNSERITFSVDTYGVVTGDTVINDKQTEVIITKTDNKGTGLKDAEITVTSMATNDVVYTGLTNADGKLVITGLTAGDYKFNETKAPTGFVIDSKDYFFTINPDGTISGTTNIINVPTDVIITKTDLTTGEPVPGAEITIYDKDGVEVYRDITDNNGQINPMKLPVGNYTFKETINPNGYQLNTSSFEFAINSDGTVTGDTSFTDAPTKWVITKTDLTTGDVLPNAEITVYDTDGNIYYKGKTDNAGKLILTYIPIGEYTFKETGSPTGYELNTDVFKFTVNSDGTVTGDNTITDKKIRKITTDKKLIKSPKTGNDDLLIWIGNALIATSLGCIVSKKTKKKKNIDN